MPSSAERKEWFQNIITAIPRQLAANEAANVCVFQVPKLLRSVAPEAYAPQMVSLGPYHHLRPDVREMERVKMDATCQFLKVTDYGSFTGLVARLSKMDQNVRACYQKFLELDDNQLAWIMMVDSSFLFNFLCHHSIDKTALKSKEWLPDLAKPVWGKLAEDAIIRDVMMLENQIPIFFMEMMLRILCSSLDANYQMCFVEDLFPQILVAFCKAISPVKVIGTCALAKPLKRAHLLDLLYAMVVPPEDESSIDISAEAVLTPSFRSPSFRSSVYGVSAAVCSRFSPFKNGTFNSPEAVSPEAVSPKSVSVINEMGPSAFNKALEVAMDLDFPGVQPFAQMGKDLVELISGLGNAPLTFQQKDPVADDTLIPRASNLAKAGIKFCKTETITDIRFDNRKATFHLPVIQVGVNTEVIVRNLVAYEAIAMSNFLVFTRYVELMSSLLHTEDDVKLLRDSKILISRMTDNDVKSIFNGVSKHIQLNRHTKLDRTIMDVRKFCNSSLKARVQMWMRKSMFWKILSILAILLYVLLIAFRSFCSAGNCASLRRTGTST